MTIRTKLNLSFIILVLSMALVGLMGMVTTQKVNDTLARVKKNIHERWSFSVIPNPGERKRTPAHPGRAGGLLPGH